MKLILLISLYIGMAKQVLKSHKWETQRNLDITSLDNEKPCSSSDGHSLLSSCDCSNELMVKDLSRNFDQRALKCDSSKSQISR
jgi:hypothetical protein